ncbi:hypothetical protein [Mesorhizobium sp. ES1-4]|uniref:hypothetical protein n=1 Tax=Mesorhizobium sp. ES1-4 TaxID=2876627 RepID=UPI001CCC9DAD|nr:hypothetical protein [Mesorhizobium sp. ES1-4]MBZ9798717.1 hypothetical protein [Mesorhizobium sp. ES1-4]
MNQELKASVARIGIAPIQAHQDYMAGKIGGVDAIVILHRAMDELLNIGADNRDLDFVDEMAAEARVADYNAPMADGDTLTIFRDVDPVMTVRQFGRLWSDAVERVGIEIRLSVDGECNRAFAAYEIMDCVAGGDAIPPLLLRCGS